MLPNLGVGEILLILVVALLLFGAKRLPELGRSLGQTVNSFKKGLHESADDGEEKKSN